MGHFTYSMIYFKYFFSSKTDFLKKRFEHRYVLQWETVLTLNKMIAVQKLSIKKSISTTPSSTVILIQYELSMDESKHETIARAFLGNETW